jgi:hypothetical protein
MAVKTIIKTASNKKTNYLGLFILSRYILLTHCTKKGDASDGASPVMVDNNLVSN